MAVEQPGVPTQEPHPCANPDTYKPLPLGKATSAPVVQEIYNKRGETNFFATNIDEAAEGADKAYNNCYKTCTEACTSPTACVTSLPTCCFNLFGCVGCCFGCATGCMGTVLSIWEGGERQSGGVVGPLETPF